MEEFKGRKAKPNICNMCFLSSSDRCWLLHSLCCLSRTYINSLSLKSELSAGFYIGGHYWCIRLKITAALLRNWRSFRSRACNRQALLWCHQQHFNMKLVPLTQIHSWPNASVSLLCSFLCTLKWLFLTSPWGLLKTHLLWHLSPTSIKAFFNFFSCSPCRAAVSGPGGHDVVKWSDITRPQLGTNVMKLGCSFLLLRRSGAWLGIC